MFCSVLFCSKIYCTNWNSFVRFNLLTRPSLFSSWRASTLMCRWSRCSWLWAYFLMTLSTVSTSGSLCRLSFRMYQGAPTIPRSTLFWNTSKNVPKQPLIILVTFLRALFEISSVYCNLSGKCEEGTCGVFEYRVYICTWKDSDVYRGTQTLGARSLYRLNLYSDG